jgi:transcriptional regulator with GAF, ATPase, and Fis domain
VEAPTDAALRALASYPWPGNVRELRNVIFEALVQKRAGTELLLSDLPRRILRRDAPRAPAGDDGLVSQAAVRRLMEEGRFDLRRARDELERTALAAALARAGGAAAAAARLLGRVGRGAARDPGGTVRAMMQRLGLSSGRARRSRRRSRR